MRFVILSIVVCFSFLSFAQPQKIMNYSKFDRRLAHYGFMLGANISHVKVSPRLDAYSQHDLLSVESLPQPGASVGILTTVKLGIPIFRLRFLPSITFQEKLIRYRFLKYGGTLEQPYINDERVGHVYLDFPLMLQLRTMRYNNFAAIFPYIRYALRLLLNSMLLHSIVFLNVFKHTYQNKSCLITRFSVLGFF